jgi:hypothetical protein
MLKEPKAASKLWKDFRLMPIPLNAVYRLRWADGSEFRGSSTSANYKYSKFCRDLMRETCSEYYLQKFKDNFKTPPILEIIRPGQLPLDQWTEGEPPWV